MEARLGLPCAEGAEPTRSPASVTVALGSTLTLLDCTASRRVPDVGLPATAACVLDTGVASPRSRKAPALSPVSREAVGGGLNGGSDSPPLTPRGWVLVQRTACWLWARGLPCLPGPRAPGPPGPLAGPLPADSLFTPSQVSLSSSEGIPQVQSLLRTPEALTSVLLLRLPSVGPQNSFSPSALLTSEAWSFSVHWGMVFFWQHHSEWDLSSLSRD